MSSNVSNGQSSPNVVRPTAAFEPSVWGDRFLNVESGSWVQEQHALMEAELGELKKDLRTMLTQSRTDSFGQLKLIDDIQRLGVEYHFEREIADALECIYGDYLDHGLKDNATLHHVSLRFRLLRQQRFNISCDTLNPFRDAEGKFKEHLATDLEGLLSLFEASFLSFGGETALDEALVFSTGHLEAISKHESCPLSGMIVRALKYPLWKSLVRTTTTHFISIYQDLPSYNQILLRFAKLDYNLLQSLYKKELYDLCKWRKDLDFATKLPFARDRIVESYFWSLATHFEPQTSLSRRITSKLVYLATFIDDIYDAYGTFEELTLFTSAIRSWSRDRMSELPEYMQLCYQSLLDLFKEIEEDMIEQGTSYRYSYAKEAMIKLIEYYYEQAKWLENKYQPTFDEYISLASKSIGVSCYLQISSSGDSSEGATKDDFEWMVGEPKFVKSAELIFRLLNDIASKKVEKQREHIPTSVECYANQYEVTEEKAIVLLKKKISDSWKDMNEDFMEPTALSRPLLTRILHLVRSAEEIYKEDDHYTSSGKHFQEQISAMFCNASPL